MSRAFFCGNVILAVGEDPVRTGVLGGALFSARKDTMAVFQRKEVSLPADVMAAIVQAVAAVMALCNFILRHHSSLLCILCTESG